MLYHYCMNNAIILFSGGLDSAALLHKIKNKYDKVLAITFDYGQRNSIEIDKAKNICNKWNIEHRIIDIKSLNFMFDKTSLLSLELDTTKELSEMKKDSFVPNRNMIFVSLATALAINEQYLNVYVGNFEYLDNQSPYPDNNHKFWTNLRNTVNSYENVKLHTMYTEDLNSKDLVLKYVLENFDVSDTYSCYNGSEIECGKCPPCIEKQKAYVKLSNYRN